MTHHWHGPAPPSYRPVAGPHLGHRSGPLQIHSMRRCRPRRRTLARARESAPREPHRRARSAPYRSRRRLWRPPNLRACCRYRHRAGCFRRKPIGRRGEPPPIDKCPRQNSFAHREPAEHNDFAEQKRGGFGQIDLEAAMDPRAVEQDRLLRQPRKMRAAFGPERDIQLCRRTSPAVDFLRRRCRDSQPRIARAGNINVEAIAAAVLTSTAESPASSGEGKRTRNDPASCNSRRRVTPSTPLTSNRTAPLARLAAKIAAL
jgi:hypothetical protein